MVLVYDEKASEQFWFEGDKDFMVNDFFQRKIDQVRDFDRIDRMFHQKTNAKDNMIQQDFYGFDGELNDFGNRKIIPQPDHNIDELYSDPSWSDCKRKCDGTHQLCSSAVQSPFGKWRCNIARLRCRKSCHNAPHL
eukprot:TCONS_00020921-protein